MTQLLASIDAWATIWMSSLWRATWQGAVVIAAVLAIARWWRPLSPRVACWMWRLVCLKMLVALAWAQPISLPLLRVGPAAAIAEAATSTPLPKDAAIDDTPPRQALVAVELPAERPLARPHSWVGVLMIAWLVGISLRMARTIQQWMRVRRLCRSAIVVESPLVKGLVEQEAKRLELRRAPDVRRSPRTNSPLLAGAWRPTIILPAEAESRFDTAELRLILAHELAHHQRRDLSWNWLPTVVGWLFYFHPMVWVLTRRWSESIEAACDELLIQRRAAPPADYGRLLLRLATQEGPIECSTGLATVGVLGSYRQLERRLLAMARVRSFSAPRLALAGALVLVVALIVTIPWRLVAGEAAQKEATDPAAASDAAQPHAPVAAPVPHANPASPYILFAEHVILWDNQIVTWDEVLKRFRLLRVAGPFTPQFIFTHAVINHKERGYKFWHDQIKSAYRELFQPIGVSFRTMSFNASQRYDAIRTAADLIPNPEHARHGHVLTPGAQRAAGGQVVLLPKGGVARPMLDGARLRDPFDEVWTTTDAEGSFTVFPGHDDYLVAVLHPTGFTLCSGPAKGAHLEIKLKPWATVTFESTGEAAGQTATITSTPEGTEHQFTINSIATHGEPLEILAPPGRISVSRSLQTDQGVSINLPGETFSLGPGGKRVVTIAAATEADRQQAENLHKTYFGAPKDDVQGGPPTERRGQVLTADGQPAADAQVVILPAEGDGQPTLQGTHLRDQKAEEWVPTDSQGRFVLSRKDDKYVLAVLHPLGFALEPGPQAGEEPVLRLQPWATLTFETTSPAHDQTITVSSKPKSSTHGFWIYSLESQGKPLEVLVPPGEIAVRRAFRFRDGALSFDKQLESFSLAAGGKRTLSLSQASDEDREWAKRQYQQFLRDHPNFPGR